SELRNFVGGRLPDYMVPAGFVFMDRFPTLPSGKVNRNALPEPVPVAEVKNSARFSTPTEEFLANIWTQALGVPAVNRDDNFFELGGDSIMALQIVAKANEGGFPLTYRQIFTHQTIAELASQVNGSASGNSSLAPLTGEVILTPAQRILLERYVVNPHHYNQAALLSP